VSEVARSSFGPTRSRMQSRMVIHRCLLLLLVSLLANLSTDRLRLPVSIEDTSGRSSATPRDAPEGRETAVAGSLSLSLSRFICHFIHDSPPAKSRSRSFPPVSRRFPPLLQRVLQARRARENAESLGGRSGYCPVNPLTRGTPHRRDKTIFPVYHKGVNGTLLRVSLIYELREERA